MRCTVSGAGAKEARVLCTVKRFSDNTDRACMRRQSWCAGAGGYLAVKKSWRVRGNAI